MATELVLLGTAGAPLPVAGRAGISSALIAGDRVLVVDCGRGSPSAFAGAGLDFSRLEAVFLTHLHADHTGDLGGMLLGTLGALASIFRDHVPAGCLVAVRSAAPGNGSRANLTARLSRRVGGGPGPWVGFLVAGTGSCWSAGVRELLEAGDRGGELTGPVPRRVQPQCQPAPAAGDAPGNGEQVQPESSVLGGPVLAVQGQQLQPCEQVGGEGDDLAPDGVLVHRVQRQAGKAGVFGAADPSPGVLSLSCDVA